MEVKRQLHVLDTQLGKTEYIAGEDYTIADIAIWPWYGAVTQGAAYVGSDEFISEHDYAYVARLANAIGAREAVKRGRMVNRSAGTPETQLKERHSASDFENNREDMVIARGGARV